MKRAAATTRAIFFFWLAIRVLSNYLYRQLVGDDVKRVDDEPQRDDGHVDGYEPTHHQKQLFVLHNLQQIVS